jgi:hypothetical protein
VALFAIRLTEQISVPGIQFAPDLRLSPLVLAFSLAVTVVTALLFGLLPAWQSIACPRSQGRAGERCVEVPRHPGACGHADGASIILLISAGLFDYFHSRRLVEHLVASHSHGGVRVSMAHYNAPEEID